MTTFVALDNDAQIAAMHDIAHSALGSWGLSKASITLLKYRENAVYKVQSDDFVGALRVHQPDNRSDRELKSEFDWMAALARSGIAVPEVVPTVNGRQFVSQSLPGLDCTAQVDLFEWIDGEQLGSLEQGISEADRTAETYRMVGQLAARVHNQAEGWSPPPGFERQIWDEHGLAGEAPLWGEFWKLEAASRSQAALLEKCRRHVHEQLARLPKDASGFSMIHADLVPENLMVSGDEVKLIDFDDAGFGWHMFELATALYFITDEPYYPAARDALFAGYRKERSLTDEQIALLPLFLLARATTYLGWVHNRKSSDTAAELTPYLLEKACDHADRYFSEI